MTDLLFRGGRVFTGASPDPRHLSAGHTGGSGSSSGPSFAEAVLVRDGRIAAVGTEADVTRRARPGHTPVDLRGRLLTPGFTDAHIHPVQAGLERARCDLSEVFGLDAYLERISEYAAARPGREWIDGGGWDMAAFPGGLPHRTQIDVPRPARST